MTGVVIKMEEDITTILTDDNRLLEVNSLFLPVKLGTGDRVEIDGNKIVLRP
ncbi:hypothetical protein [Fonticella tunisiensis]|uniref:Uncharacterized protein n=1 Tax=Fonticella tunisiensis TaxID=1096341 RepID=A0A4R7KNY4_9CLOT|nr:hypothetical protein [Fonticella tunisiensis]TDT58401.1 hypothetical protein EDD71_11136 [Fonticella tunisiensis]